MKTPGVRHIFTASRASLGRKHDASANHVELRLVILRRNRRGLGLVRIGAVADRYGMPQWNDMALRSGVTRYQSSGKPSSNHPYYASPQVTIQFMLLHSVGTVHMEGDKVFAVLTAQENERRS